MEKKVIESINKVMFHCGRVDKWSEEDCKKYQLLCGMVPFPLKPVSRSRSFYANRNKKGKEITTF